MYIQPYKGILHHIQKFWYVYVVLKISLGSSLFWICFVSLWHISMCVWEKFPVNSLYIYVCNITWRIDLNILRTSLIHRNDTREYLQCLQWALSDRWVRWKRYERLESRHVSLFEPKRQRWETFMSFISDGDSLRNWCDVFLYKMYMDLIHYDSFRNQWCVLLYKKYMKIKMGISMLIRHNMSQKLSFYDDIWKPREKSHLVSSH